MSMPKEFLTMEQLWHITRIDPRDPKIDKH
jgi:hypothetical protein